MEEKKRLKGKIIAVALVGLSLLYFGSGFRLRLGTLKSPGPGFFPLIIGAMLAVLSIVYLIRTLRANSSEKMAFVEEICRAVEDASSSRTGSADEICDRLESEAYHPAAKEETLPTRLPREVIAILACTLLYPFLLSPLKFVPATFLVCFAMLLSFKPGKPLFGFLLSLGLVIGSFFFFGRFFGVPLPSGFIEVWIYSIGG